MGPGSRSSSHTCLTTTTNIVEAPLRRLGMASRNMISTISTTRSLGASMPLLRLPSQATRPVSLALLRLPLSAGVARPFSLGRFTSNEGKSELLNTPTARAAAAATAFVPAPGSSSGNGTGGSFTPPPPRKRRGFFKRVRRVLFLSTLGAVAFFSYSVYEANNPPDQLPQDPSKKTIVILGSGWGATALLKDINTDDFNVIVISKTNSFLYTPLLPQVTVGTVNARSIAQPTRQTTRFKSREVQVLEAEATKIDTANKTVSFEDKLEVYGKANGAVVTIPYDYLVVAVGSQNNYFGIEGIRKHGFFLKELNDASRIRNRILDCIEKASLVGQDDAEIDRLLHIVVVGGGPTGVEFAGECHDFIEHDLSKWYPQISKRVRVTLVEALPSILPMFSKGLIEYTQNEFQAQHITILAKHQVQDLTEEEVVIKSPEGTTVRIPCGMLVWAAGNTSRPLSRDLMSQLSKAQTERRGIKVDEYMRVCGAEDSIFAIGDATATAVAPTAQAASQQGSYLAKVFGHLAKADKLESELEEAKAKGAASNEIARLERKVHKAAAIPPFKFTNNGALAYIGSDKAIADIPIAGGTTVAASGTSTYYFWRSAYLSMLFSLRSRSQVLADWCHVSLYGRDITRE